MTQISAFDRLRLAATLALLLGILLFDRGFTSWRNDPRNFPDADGAPLPPGPDAPPIDFTERHHLVQPLEYSGAGLLVLSVVLFSVRDDTKRP